MNNPEPTTNEPSQSTIDYSQFDPSMILDAHSDRPDQMQTLPREDIEESDAKYLVSMYLDNDPDGTSHSRGNRPT